VHGDLLLRGGFVWLIDAVGLVLVAGAIAILVSALRRPLTDFGRLGRAPWVGLQTLFLVLAAFALVSSLLKFSSALPRWFAGIVGAVVVLAAIQQIGYLLRVVYPSPKRLARRGDGPQVAGAENAGTDEDSEHGTEE
jgi:hypothetical protein